MKLLCTEDKCILLPVCMAKKYIECDLLYSFIEGRKKTNLESHYIEYALFWKQAILDAFPHLKKVIKEGGHMYYGIPRALDV